MNPHIILTTGIYDLIKDQVRRRRVTPDQAERLTTELRHAKQVRRNDLPKDIVDINSKVTVRYPGTGEQQTHTFVQPGKQKQKHQTESIMTPIGIALVGYPEGALIKWPFPEGEREIEVLKVERV